MSDRGVDDRSRLSWISATLMSMRTLKCWPLQFTVAPRSTAHVQIGRAKSSLPSQAPSHWKNGRRLIPPGRQEPSAKEGVFSSASTLCNFWSLLVRHRSITIHATTDDIQMVPIVLHDCEIPKVLWNQGSVVSANDVCRQHTNDSTPGSTSVAAKTVHFRTRSQRTRRAM